MAFQLRSSLNTMKRSSDSHLISSKRHLSHWELAKKFLIRFYISLFLTVPILIFSPSVQNWLQLQMLSFNGSIWVLLALGAIVFGYCGWPFLKGGFLELRSFNPGTMTLLAFAIMAAFFYSCAVVIGFSGNLLFWELALLIDIMLLGRIIEMHSIATISKSMHLIHKSIPGTVHKINQNEIIDFPLSGIVINDQILVNTGERIPADGLVIKGESVVSEVMLTGDSNPVYKRSGFKVMAGSINLKASFTFKVESTLPDSYLSQITELVENAPLSSSQSQHFADKAAKILTLFTIISAAASFIVWKLVFNQDFAFSLERMVTVMAIACPHAPGLAIPLVLAVSASISATSGILIKNRKAFEAARKIKSVIFEKTGTLTEGRFGVADIEVFHRGVNRDELIKYAASVEIRSHHPVAKGIVQFSGDTFEATEFSDITGKGASALVEGRDVKVVSQSYLNEHNIRINGHYLNYINRLREGGRTVVYVLINDELYGAITLSDIIRAESRTAVKTLKRMGIKTVMLTGDNRSVAKYVAQELQLDGYYAEIPPQEKAFRIKELQNQGIITAMTGDSVHDASALAQADIGFAIGTGTDIALKSADIVLVHNNPLDVVKAIHISKITHKKMNQNLFWAVFYNLIALPVAAGAFAPWGILLNPASAAILMSVSTFFIALNSRHLHIQQ